MKTGFSLWCDFEELSGKDAARFDPDCDYGDVLVSFRDGRKYLLKVWTFAFLIKVAAGELAAPGRGLPEKVDHLVPPDLLVTRLDRPTVQAALTKVIDEGEIDFSSDVAPLSDGDEGMADED